MKKKINQSLISAVVIASIASPAFADNSIQTSLEGMVEASNQGIGIIMGSAQGSYGFSKERYKDSKEAASEARKALKKGVKYVITNAETSSNNTILFLKEQCVRLEFHSKTAASDSERAMWIVVKTSGVIIEASLNESRTLIGVSVDTFKGSKDAIVKAGKHILGKLEAAPEWSVDRSNDARQFSQDVSQFSMDTAGDIYDSSKRKIGKVKDFSGNTVEFLKGKSQEFYTESKESTIVVLKASRADMKQFSADFAASTGQIVVELKASSNGSAILITDSAKKSYLFMTKSLEKVLESIELALFGDT